MEKATKPHQIWATTESDPLTPPHQSSDYKLYLCSGKRLLHKLAYGCVPSFLQRRTTRPNSPKSQRLHPTSYLDGLRGVASFIVFMGHYTEENLGWWTEPYGLYEDGAVSSPLQLPFIRVIYSARPMVHIFFIISGFVLAYKPLKQIHSRQYSSLASTLSSSVFRRALRLFLPSIITLFIMALAVHFEISQARYGFPLWTLSAQLEDWYITCWQLLKSSWALDNPDVPQPRYNPALWTIPVEFAQSMLLFIVILGLSHVRINMRFLILTTIILFCFWSGQLFAVEFLGGMLIAEITLLQANASSNTDISPISSQESSPILPTSEFIVPNNNETSTSSYTKTCIRHTTPLRNTLLKIFWILNLTCGLFISSWTNRHVDEIPILRTLDAHTPHPYNGQRMWFSLAAFQIVIACTQLRSLQTLFNLPIPQYLGNISYALYLTHNLCLTTLEPIFVPIFDVMIGKGTFLGRHLVWVAGLAVYGPVILCVADIFWRAVDVPTVKLAKWMESYCEIDKEDLSYRS